MTTNNLNGISNAVFADDMAMQGAITSAANVLS